MNVPVFDSSSHRCTASGATPACIGLFIACLAVLLAPGPALAQLPFSRVVVFGTSLSDPGNAHALLGGTNVPPDYSVDPFLVPDRPYARGGLHFSNGPTWIEQFARLHGLSFSAQAAFRAANVSATNYAVGAARAYDDGASIGLRLQVDAFLQQHGGAAPADALYVFEMGSNDVRDALVAFVSGEDANAVIQAAVTSIAGSVMTLHAAGARRFLIWNAPNVALTPAIRALNTVSPGAVQLATGLTLGFNGALESVISGLTLLPGIRIARLDAYQVLSGIVQNPAAFGLVNVSSACIDPGTEPFVCENPDEYLFWDGIHPTRAVHAIVAQQATLVLAGN